MTGPLHADGAEKEILLHGLREYSDRCEAPKLTPTCPYYQLDRSGPWCLEQCMDLLAAHPEPAPPDQLVLTPELAARPRRPRARRGRTGPAKPFDAGELHLEDQANPDLARWQP